MATIKQKLAFKEAVKGSSLTKAMVKAGFSKKSAKHTNTLTRTKGWHELIDKYISEEDLMKVHKAGLRATKTVYGATIGEDGEELSDAQETPDFAVRHKYLETGYKVRGRLKETPNAPPTNIINIFASEQLKRVAARVLDDDPTSTRTPDRLPDSNESKV